MDLDISEETPSFHHGGLFKQSGFFKQTSSKSWGKRFFIFNTRTMLLQYWAADEERIFKIEGAVRSIPKSSISLLSSSLKIVAGPVERSMFGSKFPIVISNGPAFKGKTLVLGTASATVRESWIGVIRGALEELKERQKLAKVEAAIVTDPRNAEFKSLGNQHRIMKQREGMLKEFEAKIRRTMVQLKMSKQQNNDMFAALERTHKAHRDNEDKLWSLTCEETHPQHRFRYIVNEDYNSERRKYPYGIYKHTADEAISAMYHDKDCINVVKDRAQVYGPFAYGVPPNNTRAVRLQNMVKHPDQTYQKEITDHVIVDNIDKEYDESKKRQFPLSFERGGFQIKSEADREYYGTSDYIMEKSLKHMGVFDLLSKDKKRLKRVMSRYGHLGVHDEEDAEKKIDDIYLDSNIAKALFEYTYEDETEFKKKMDRNLAWDTTPMDHFKDTPADWDYHQNLELVEEMHHHADYWLYRLYYDRVLYSDPDNEGWYDDHPHPLHLKQTDTDTAPKYAVEGRAKGAGRFGLDKQHRGCCK